MKIVLAIFKFFPFGGLQLDFIRLASKLASRGHQIICCAGSWEGSAPEGIAVKVIPLHSRTNHGRAKEFERKFQAYLAAEKPDRSIVFNRMAGGDFYFAADNCFLPVWQKKHSPFVLKILPRYRTFLAQERAVFERGGKTKIFYIVEKQKEEYTAAYGTEADRFFYLPPGMNDSCRMPENALAIRAQKRAELGIQPDEVLFLLVAAQFQLKGADRVIRAMAHLPEHVRSFCRLLLCGDSKSKPQLELAKECGIASQVIFRGPSKDIPAILQAADLMVHPARLEAAGTVLSEAIAAGLPVVCSGLCGFSNFVHDAGGIVLPEPYRDEDLLQTLTALTMEPVKLAEMKRTTIRYAQTADFYRRADVAAEIIEGTAF